MFKEIYALEAGVDTLFGVVNFTKASVINVRAVNHY